MLSSDDLLSVADAFMHAQSIKRETTVSHRVFSDTKTLGKLRDGADITVRRLRLAFEWFDANWPDGVDKPPALEKFIADTKSPQVDAVIPH